MTDIDPRQLSLSEKDLPTLRRIRDLHRRWADEGAPDDMTADEALGFMRQVTYTAQWCDRVITALDEAARQCPASPMGGGRCNKLRGHDGPHFRPFPSGGGFEWTDAQLDEQLRRDDITKGT